MANPWMLAKGYQDVEAARLAELRKPFGGNPATLMAKVRCRVLKPFCVAGQRVEPDQVVELARHDAESLCAAGKVELK